MYFKKKINYSSREFFGNVSVNCVTTVKWVYPDETVPYSQHNESVYSAIVFSGNSSWAAAVKFRLFISKSFSPSSLLLCQIAVLNPKKILLALRVCIGNSRLPVSVISRSICGTSGRTKPGCHKAMVMQSWYKASTITFSSTTPS